MSLTPKERVIAQIEHRETDYVPYTLRFEGDVAERLDEHFGSDQWRALVDNAIRRLPAPRLEIHQEGSPTYTDAYGSVWQVDGAIFHLVSPALKEPTLDGLTFPPMDEVFPVEWEEAMYQAIEDQKDHFLVISFGLGLFDRSWALRGMEDALMDVVGHPNFCEALLDRLTEHQMEIVDHLLNLPVDGILFADDWGYQDGVMIGPERWRRLFKPRYARLYGRVREAGKYVLTHCCGSIASIMEDLIEIGLDVYQSVQPEAKGNNPYDLKRRYGDRIAFWGGLGSQSVIPFATPREIRAEVDRLCREMAAGGGYILAPAKALQPDTPTANAAAVVESFLEQSGVSVK